MDITDKYSYYSKHFNIICERDEVPVGKAQTYSLVATKSNGEHIKTVSPCTEDQLYSSLEDLRNEIYLNL